MKFTFADTQGWAALSNKKDQFHQQAIAIKNRLISQHTKFITSNFVLDETYTLLLTRIGHAAAVEFGEMIRHTPSVELIRVTDVLKKKPGKYLNSTLTKHSLLLIAPLLSSCDNWA